MCDSFILFFHVLSIDVNLNDIKALRRHITSSVLRQTIFSTQHTRASILLRPPTQTERGREVPIRQATTEISITSTSRPPCSYVACISAAPASPHSHIRAPRHLQIKTTVHEQFFLRRRTRAWNSAGAANGGGGGSVLSGEVACNAGLGAT